MKSRKDKIGEIKLLVEISRVLAKNTGTFCLVLFPMIEAIEKLTELINDENPRTD